jgi:hypothetical protein
MQQSAADDVEDQHGIVTQAFTSSESACGVQEGRLGRLVFTLDVDADAQRG